MGTMKAHHKLKHLKVPIKLWNKHNFGNIDVNIEALVSELWKLDEVRDTRVLLEVELARDNAL